VVSISSQDVEITATQDLTLSADNALYLNANEIYAETYSYMRLKSHMNLDLEGVNIDAQASSNLDLEGSASTSLSSSAITDITGSLVTIN